MVNILDEEREVKLSVQEIMVILDALESAIITFERLSHPDPIVNQQISTRLELLWPLEQRLKHHIEEASNEFNNKE